MKLVVPLMIPAIHSMRLAVRPSRSALMIGMPPATAASKATTTPFSRAAAKISVPCTASSALLAVTTCLPAAIASSTSAAGDPGAADQLDHDVDVGPVDQRARVGADLGGAAGDPARAFEVDVDDMGDADLAAGAAPDLLLVALQDRERAAADDAGAEQPDLERFHANEGWPTARAACRAR